MYTQSVRYYCEPHGDVYTVSTSPVTHAVARQGRPASYYLTAVTHLTFPHFPQITDYQYEPCNTHCGPAGASC
ncbi:hypothetical protein J6590_079500 [Homalodisca vitripennis]|nr:hypothetical protein J6590_079500 [Homalodisca vitripennis]